MSKKHFIGFILLSVLLCNCSGAKKTEQETQPEKSKTLVLYYSQTGTTKEVADELQKQLGADIDSIVAVESYGYDYDATIERWRKEREDSVKVAIRPLNVNVNDYDTIFLGFPIWGGTFASPVATWLADNKLEGKTIITFATFGSGGLESSTSDVKTEEPASNVIEGYGVRAARIAKSPEEINRWLIENDYKKGEIQALPGYGEELPVSSEEIAIFKEATDGYRFPLGTPVMVAKRGFEGTMDYKFDVISQTPDGKEIRSVVFVTKTPDEKPEFTRVIRE